MIERRIHLLAHNIRSLWNVGSLFRTCDGFGVEKLYLSGYTATPPRREITKTALGAEKFISWEHIEDPLKCMHHLKSEGFSIVALEQDPQAIALSTFEAPEKLCLIIGHEVSGVPEVLLDHCDAIVEIPMHGQKESLNVAVAAGVALYALTGN